MLESTCFCLEILRGEDMDALVGIGVDHFGSAHAQLRLTEPSIRNYFEGERRVDGPVDRLADIGQIVIRPISGETRDDIIEFFDRRAFADNIAWSACYCMYHHVGGDETGPWPYRTWQQNRSDLAARIDTGRTTGVVAYVDGELAGFCNANARSEFVTRSRGDDEGIGSIVCFVVAPPYRRHGVSRAMLQGAVEALAAAGFDQAEAYPVNDSGAAVVSAVEQIFVGTLSLYEGEGFEIVSDDPLVVRKALS